MKFIKSNFAKKIIIILILLMILSMTILKPVHAAWNFSGILMKPITNLILSFLTSIDVQLGLFMLAIDATAEGLRRRY